MENNINHFILSLQQTNTNFNNQNSYSINTYYIPFTIFNNIILTNNLNNNNNNILDKYTYSYYNYSFNENVSFHKNAKAELKFNMLKYINLESNFVINPFIEKIKTGSIIKYTDQYNIDRLFWVNNISYKFNKTNIEYTYDCQDYFSYYFTRRNSNYSIAETIDGFIQIKTLEKWVEKITKDCWMEYKYVKNKVNIDDFNKPMLFNVSNSNAYNALVSLGEKVGLIIEVDETITEKHPQPTFWFKPEKNVFYNGLSYSPYQNIKDFSLSQSGQTLTSILNVTSQTKLEKSINLLSDIPLKLLEYFNTEEWKNSNFFNGYFKELTGPNQKGEADSTHLKLWEYVPKDGDPEVLSEKIDEKLNSFLKIIDNIPWLESKIINFEYFSHNHLMNEQDYLYLWNLLTNELRKVNGKFLYYQKLYFDNLQSSTKTQGDIYEQIISYGANFQHYILNQIEPNTERKNTADINDISYLQTLYPKDEVYDSTTYFTKNAIELWEKAYTSLYQLLPQSKKIIELTQIINNYGNKIIRVNQEVLKNIYLFQQKLNEIQNEHKEDPSKNIVNTYSIAEQRDLTMYWEAAHKNSGLSSYFIPSDWKNTLCDITIKDSQSEYEYTLNEDKINFFIPHINKEYRPLYNKYEITKENGVTEYVDGFITELKEKTNNISWKGNGTQVEQEYYSTESFIQWNNIISQWKIKFSALNSIRAPINGLYDTYLYLLTSTNYIENDLTDLEAYQNSITEHNEVWRKIYSMYGNFLLEQTYTDSIATNSLELFNNSIRYFQDLMKPEYQYNLSIIHINQLKGYHNQKIEISDQIRLNADEFYEELDDLKEVIKQPLFVTDISYDLRSNDSIKLTVNAIKYQDKVIQRLVSLIK